MRGNAKTQCDNYNGARAVLVLLVTALGTQFAAASAPDYASGVAADAAVARPPEQVVRPAASPARIRWRARLVAKGLPKAGCFHATYPSTVWRETPCTPAPAIHFPRIPPRPPTSLTPGAPSPSSTPPAMLSGNNIGAMVAANTITSVEATFPQVIDVTSIATGGPSGTGDYSLQLNTNYIPVSGCTNPGTSTACQGWVQFVVDTSTAQSLAYITYVLV
jgi:hypothetical protein